MRKSTGNLIVTSFDVDVKTSEKGDENMKYYLNIPIIIYQLYFCIHDFTITTGGWCCLKCGYYLPY